MEFDFTDAFYSIYESLNDEDVEVVDDAIRRLLVDHSTAWARQGRVEGDKGGAWILSSRSRTLDASLYWDYHNDTTLILVALVVRHG